MSEVELNNCPQETLECEHCGKANMKIWPYAKAEVVNVFNFQCAFCKKLSKKYTYEGLIKQGPIAREDSRFFTFLEDVIDNEGYTTFVWNTK